MVESYPHISCVYCTKRIVRERVGWRSDEHDPEIDRVKCPESPQAHPYDRKHVPAEMMSRVVVQAGCCGPELQAGNPS